MTFSLLPRDGKSLAESKHMVIQATGNTGNDGNTWAGNVSLGFGGNLSVEDPEGFLQVQGDATIYALDVYGNRIYELKKTAEGFQMGTGEAAALGFEILLK